MSANPQARNLRLATAIAAVLLILSTIAGVYLYMQNKQYSEDIQTLAGNHKAALHDLEAQDSVLNELIPLSELALWGEQVILRSPAGSGQARGVILRDLESGMLHVRLQGMNPQPEDARYALYGYVGADRRRIRGIPAEAFMKMVPLEIERYAMSFEVREEPLAIVDRDTSTFPVLLQGGTCPTWDKQPQER